MESSRVASMSSRGTEVENQYRKLRRPTGVFQHFGSVMSSYLLAFPFSGRIDARISQIILQTGVGKTLPQALDLALDRAARHPQVKGCLGHGLHLEAFRELPVLGRLPPQHLFHVGAQVRPLQV